MLAPFYFVWVFSINLIKFIAALWIGLTEETALGSLSPYFDPDLMGQGGVGHGNVSDSYGVTVRWHRVALGITVGIPIDEWDDAIHVKSEPVHSLWQRVFCYWHWWC